jgi:monoamine oxidase
VTKTTFATEFEPAGEPEYERIPDGSPFSYSSSENLQYLKKSHTRRTNDRKDIAVIGAGMSGLTAAWLLKQKGHNVTIFEAKHVVGGRVKTLRERFTNGLYAEAGAMRIPSHHVLTHYLISLFGLELGEFFQSSLTGLIYINSRRSNFDTFRDEAIRHGFKLKDGEKLNEREMPDALFERAVIAYICDRHRKRLEEKGQTLTGFADFRDPNFSQELFYNILNDLDQYSIIQFLKNKAVLAGQRLSQAAIDMIGTYMMWEMQMSSSMAAAVSLEIEMSVKEPEKFEQIKGGMDYLPKGFLGPQFLPAESQRKLKNNPPCRELPNLEENIRYNSRVISVFNQPPKLVVCYENTMTKYLPSPECFDLLVVAIPFSAIRHIRMPGLVTNEKRQAIRQLSYSNSCKIILEFSHRFWEDDLPGQRKIEKGGKSVTDLPIRLTYYPSLNQRWLEGEERSLPVKGGLVLASYTWGDDSIRWTSLTHSDRLRFALRDLEYLHDRTEDRLFPSCVGGMSHSWAEDEFTSGAFAQFGPYQRIQNFEFACMPEHNIYYCGEHVSTKHGWIEGAVESGIRVAKEVEKERGRKWRPRLEKAKERIDG